MKVLVATSRTQGDRPGDFNDLVAGELVVPGFACDRPDCGCERAWVGLASRKGGTTAEVVDRDLTPDQYLDAFTTHEDDPDPDDLADLKAQALELLDVAATFDTGDIVRRDRERIFS